MTMIVKLTIWKKLFIKAELSDLFCKDIHQDFLMKEFSKNKGINIL